MSFYNIPTKGPINVSRHFAFEDATVDAILRNLAKCFGPWKNDARRVEKSWSGLLASGDLGRDGSVHVRTHSWLIFSSLAIR